MFEKGRRDARTTMGAMHDELGYPDYGFRVMLCPALKERLLGANGGQELLEGWNGHVLTMQFVDPASDGFVFALCNEC